MYDTYVGTLAFQDMEDPMLERLGEEGCEFGATTGRRRQCNYLNLDDLKEALIYNQCTDCIINKVDVIERVNVYRLYYKQKCMEFVGVEEMKSFIKEVLSFVKVTFSSNPYEI
jgi:adenylosuccinate synthase